ncbi:hypothetical protein BUALT_Bualt16G0090700 [Buddleja alternifolia]|uniref:Knottins-like domain-containing protein n=1 Tax=Buddleja alternifolia TaxID=168488 RepID=A0AAV6WKW1_9LAMI|nr:hypothetical protein BUALT_Bualt16G0090700 [Buddleja alternifolia]
MFSVLLSPLTLLHAHHLPLFLLLGFASGGGAAICRRRLWPRFQTRVGGDEVYSEATRMCKSRSREHKGRRCYNRNCNIICKHEGFVYGRCSRYKKCYCFKPCGDGGGQEGPDPGQDPPPTPSLPKSSTLA